MLGLVTRDWWVFATRGIAALVFGVLAFIWPALPGWTPAYELLPGKRMTNYAK